MEIRTWHQDEIEANFCVIEGLLPNFVVGRLLDVPLRPGKSLVVVPVSEQHHLHLTSAAVGEVARYVALLAGLERVPENVRGAHLVRHVQEDGEAPSGLVNLVLQEPPRDDGRLQGQGLLRQRVQDLLHLLSQQFLGVSQVRRGHDDSCA